MNRYQRFIFLHVVYLIILTTHTTLPTTEEEGMEGEGYDGGGHGGAGGFGGGGTGFYGGGGSVP